MESLIPWLTPALIVGLFGWVRADIRSLRQEVAVLRREMTGQRQEMNAELTGLRQEMNAELTGLRREMNARFDRVNRELADLRERMAKLEGSLEGFLAGRRDRDVA